MSWMISSMLKDSNIPNHILKVIKCLFK